MTSALQADCLLEHTAKASIILRSDYDPAAAAVAAWSFLLCSVTARQHVDLAVSSVELGSNRLARPRFVELDLKANDSIEKLLASASQKLSCCDSGTREESGHGKGLTRFDEESTRLPSLLILDKHDIAASSVGGEERSVSLFDLHDDLPYAIVIKPSVSPHGCVIEAAFDDRILSENESKQLLAAYEQLIRLLHGAPCHSPLSSIDTSSCKVRAMDSREEPFDSVEGTIAQSWGEILDVNYGSLGRNDGFVGLGGNSLLAMRLAAKLRTKGIRLSVADIFRHATIPAMAMASQHHETWSRRAAEREFIPDSTDSFADIAQQCGVAVEAIETVYPATPFQEAIFSLTSQESSNYVSQQAFVIPAHISIPQLQSAWSRVCEANDILRTRFAFGRNQRLLQVVVNGSLDWTNDAQFWQLHGEFNATPSFIGRPLFVLNIMGRSLDLSISHAIYDGWSVPLLFQDVEKAYYDQSESVTGRPQFKTFVDFLDSSDDEQHRAYWNAYLSGECNASFPNVPSSPCRPFCNDGVTKTFTLGDRTSRSVTNAAFITAAWGLLITRFVNSSDISFGYVGSGRDATVDGIEEMIGPLVATVPMRVHVERLQTVHEYLLQVQQGAHDMSPHMHYGLQNIKKISADAAHACDFRHIFVVYPEGEGTPDLSIMKAAEGWNINAANYRTYPLHVLCTLDGDYVHVEMWFDSSVLPESQVKVYLDYFQQTLDCLAKASPATTIDRALRNEAWRPQNVPFTTPASVGECIHHLIEQQAQSKPHAPAISSWDGYLTFHEMNSLSNRLAHHLKSKGVELGTLVCFHLERSALAIITILAILKAGGACVPVDSSFPPDRVQFVVDKCKSPIIICSPMEVSKLKKLATAQLLVVDLPLLQGLPDYDGAACEHVGPENLCYLLFTSGSTGAPKGVMWEHRTLSTSALVNGEALCIRSDSRVLSSTSLMWDGGALDTLVALTKGACLCVASDEVKMNKIVEFMNDQAVTWALFTPSLARSVDLESVTTLRTLILGGEVTGQDNIDRFRNRLQHLITVYGPSECCIISTAVDLTAHPEIGNANLGFPTSVNIWITDPQDPNILLPRGAVGELVMQGACVAQGYLDDSVQTSAAFLTDLDWVAHACDEARNFYRSGDLGFYNSDGSIAFAGRRDDQVKVRGQRLEPGEVEHNIRQSPGVLHTMVFVPSSTAYKGRLVAMVSLDESIVPSCERPEAQRAFESEVQKIRRRISSRLTNFAIPTLWIPMQEVPRTVTGKLDRTTIRARILELLENPRPPIFDSISLPNAPASIVETPIQKVLQGAWANVLGIAAHRISPDHSFHQLHGDSIHAIRLVSALRSQNLSLTVAQVFQQPILRDMASVICIASGRRTEIAPFALLSTNVDRAVMLQHVSTLCSVELHQIEDVYPATPLQEAVMTINTIRPATFVTNFAFDIADDVDRFDIFAAWKAVEQRNQILRTRIVHTSSTGTFQVVINEDSKYPAVDPSQRCLWEAPPAEIAFGERLVRFALNGRRLVLSMHHAAYDAFSLPMIVEDLKLAYRNEQPISRAPFRQFAAYLDSLGPAPGEAFWRAYLKGTLPSSFPEYPTATYQPTLSSSEKVEITFDRPNSGVTVATIANAALALLLASYSGQDESCFGVALTGRDVPVPGISNIIGPTLATVPSRVRINRAETANEFLKALQSDSLNVMEHQHLGLQRIKAIHEGAAAACDFRTYLVVHPVKASEGSDSIFKSASSSPEDVDKAEMANFRMYSLTVIFSQRKSGASVKLFYDDHLIDQLQAARMIRYFEHIFLDLLHATKDATVREVMRIPAAERAEVDYWAGDLPQADNESVLDKFLTRVQLAPAVQAVCAWDGSFSYAELDFQSIRLAQYLVREVDVKAGSIVAFCCVKSKWAPVAMLATMRAGAAFLPLNHMDSPARTRSLVDQCGAMALLVSPSLYEERANNARVVFSIDIADTGNDSKETVPLSISPTSTAYCIATSGSTGKPKVIVVDHSAMATHVSSLLGPVHIRAGTRVLQFAAYVWDLSIFEIWASLTSGGCICIPSEEQRLGNLTKTVSDLRAEWAFFTPTFARSLEPKDFGSLKVVVLGGEAAGADNITKWTPYVRLLGIWGVTEAGPMNTVMELHDPSHDRQLGRAVNCRLWILHRDDPNVLAPIGSVGQLAMEGPALVQGYLNDPKLMKASFIRNPVWLEPPARLYLTGDLARYDSNGCVHYIGRVDDQVKLRGQRLQLAEVESAIRGSDIAKDAIVRLPTSGPFVNRLVGAFTLSEADGDKTQDELRALKNARAVEAAQRLRDLLQETLPGFAVPSVLIAVNRLPQIASGKLDRRRLERWLVEMGEDDANHLSTNASSDVPEPPQGLIEEQLRDVWTTVLNLEAKYIGRHVSFLALGGDSISAMQIVARCRPAGLNLDVGSLMRNKTIAKAAAHVEQVQPASTPTKVNEEDYDSAFDLSPVQRLFDSLGSSSHRHNQSMLLSLHQHIDIAELEDALRKVIEHHGMLRNRLVRNSTERLQQKLMRRSEGGPRVTRIRATDTSTVETGVETMQASIDPWTRTVIGAVLIDLPTEQRLFLTAHHMVIDLVSWRIIMSNPADILSGRSLTRSKPTSYASWVDAQTALLAKPTHPSLPLARPPAPRLDYWDMSERPNVWGDAICESFHLDSADTASILGSANDAFRTETIDLLLAAALTSFCKAFPDRNSPPIFNEVHGRETADSSIDVSQTVGWFTAVQAIHVEFSNELSLQEMVKHVKEVRKGLLRNGVEAFARSMLSDDFSSYFGGPLPVEVVFNFAGSYQQLEGPAALFGHVDKGDFHIADESPDLRRLGLFEFELAVHNGVLAVEMSYNRHIRDPSRVLKWMEAFKQDLENIAREWPQLSKSATPSDYPLLQASMTQLDTILARTLSLLGVISIDDIEDTYACSPRQDGMLAAQSVNPAFYNISGIFKVSAGPNGNVDTQRLVEAWKKVVNRHPILRTICIEMPTQAARFQQVVLKHDEPEVPVLHATDDKDAISTLDTLAGPRHKDGSPAHRISICSTDTGECYLRLEISHSLCDATTSVILLTELMDLCSRRASPSLPPAPPFSDYIAYIQSQPADANLKYWTSYLASARPCLFPHHPLIPTPTPTSTSTDANPTRTINLTPTLHPLTLHTFCRTHSLTLSNLFQTAWALLLAAYTSQRDIVFGYAHSGRDAHIPNVESIAGPLLSLLIRRVEIREGETVLDLARRGQDDTLAAIAHQHFDLEEVVCATLGPLGEGKLFDTAISLRSKGSSRRKQQQPERPVRMELVESSSPTDWTLHLAVAYGEAEGVEDVEVELTYQRALMEAEQAEGVADTFERIVEALVESSTGETYSDLLGGREIPRARRRMERDC